MIFDKIILETINVITDGLSKRYVVSHYGFGIKEEVTAKSKKEAKRLVFGRLLKQGKLTKYQYNDFMDSQVREKP